jgi:hypothetical protein
MPALKPTSSSFLQAHTSKIAALKSLKREQEVIAAIEKIFADDVIGKITDSTPQQLTSVDQQLRYFLCLGYYTAMREGGAINSEYLDKIQQLVRDYEIKYPDKNAEDKVLPLIYFYAVNSLMLRSNKEDFAPAKDICDKYLERFKGHDYHATVLTVKATIIITTKDKPNLEIAIRCLEEAVEVAKIFSAAGLDNFILKTERLVTPGEEEIPETPVKPATPVLPTDADKKKIEAIAKEVIAGKWGNGTERKNRLTEAGYNYREVQDKVNELLK